MRPGLHASARLLAAVVLLAGCGGAFAQGSTPSQPALSDPGAPQPRQETGTPPATPARSYVEYRGERSRIRAGYEAEAAKCRALTGNERAVCAEQAKSARDTALAEARAQQRHTPRANRQARQTRADAQYAVARQRCEGFSGNARQVCEDRAKAEHDQAVKLIDTTAGQAAAR